MAPPGDPGGDVKRCMDLGNGSVMWAFVLVALTFHVSSVVPKAISRLDSVVR